MFSCLDTFYTQGTPQDKLDSLALKISKEDKEIPSNTINKIIKLVKQGANLNTKVNGKTITYHLCMKADINFVLKIFELGGDPRISNDNNTSLFSPQPDGRDVFTCVCWYYYTGNDYVRSLK